MLLLALDLSAPRSPGASMALGPRQRKACRRELDLPTKSHHFLSGVPYHQHLGKAYDASRLGADVREDVPEESRV